jgi:hypothetical protein
MRGAVVVLSGLLAAALASGCRMGYRSSAGAAMAPPGLHQGVVRSVSINDEGMLLTRAGLGVLGVAVAAGSIENPQVKTTVDNVGDRTVVRQERTATIHSGPAEAGMAIATARNTSTAAGGLSSNLDIASRSLGGNTSGWQYEFGYSMRRIRRGKDWAAGFRGFAGLGFGRYKMHDWLVDVMDRGPPRFGSGNYNFNGIPTRFGVFFASYPRSFLQLVGTETYVKANINFTDHSVFHVGQRFQYSLVFIEIETSMSSLDARDRSYGIELGIGL